MCALAQDWTLIWIWEMFLTFFQWECTKYIFNQEYTLLIIFYHNEVSMSSNSSS